MNIPLTLLNKFSCNKWMEVTLVFFLKYLLDQKRPSFEVDAKMSKPAACTEIHLPMRTEKRKREVSHEYSLFVHDGPFTRRPILFDYFPLHF